MEPFNREEIEARARGHYFDPYPHDPNRPALAPPSRPWLELWWFAVLVLCFVAGFGALVMWNPD